MLERRMKSIELMNAITDESLKECRVHACIHVTLVRIKRWRSSVHAKHPKKYRCTEGSLSLR